MGTMKRKTTATGSSAGNGRRKARASSGERTSRASKPPKPSRAASPKPDRRSADHGASTPVPSAADAGAIVGVVDGDPASRWSLTSQLGDLGCPVRSLDPAELGSALAESHLEVLFVAEACLAAVSAAAAATSDGFPVVVGIVDAAPDAVLARIAAHNADLFVLTPVSAARLAPLLYAAQQLAVARDRIRAAELAEAAVRERLLRYGEADSETGFQHFDFFKHYVVTELKRAKRYRYPIAACLVAIDPWPDGLPVPPPSALRQLRIRVASAISASVRDIDVPVDLGDDRFLMFLPYTGLDGAKPVGLRVAKVVAESGRIEVDGKVHRLSVSVGIAALKPGSPVSFAQLMRHASAALRAAQSKGGGKVVVRR
jgi:GGDEF domain-containing protein